MITATAADPTIRYAGTVWVCDTGTAVGETRVDLDYGNLELDFFGNCNVSGLAATFICSEASDDDEADGDKNPFGTARLHALTGNHGPSLPEDGELDRLNEGFFCHIVVTGVCVITVGAQDLPISGGINQADYVNEPADPTTDPSGQIDVDLDARATRVGSSLCGPTNRVMGLTALSDLDPDAPTASPSTSPERTNLNLNLTFTPSQSVWIRFGSRSRLSLSQERLRFGPRHIGECCDGAGNVGEWLAYGDAL